MQLHPGFSRWRVRPAVGYRLSAIGPQLSGPPSATKNRCRGRGDRPWSPAAVSGQSKPEHLDRVLDHPVTHPRRCSCFRYCYAGVSRVMTGDHLKSQVRDSLPQTAHHTVGRIPSHQGSFWTVDRPPYRER